MVIVTLFRVNRETTYEGFFPALEEAEVKEEQFLTYDQFEKVFEKHSP